MTTTTPDVLAVQSAHMQRKRPIGTVAYMGGIPMVYEEFAWSWGQITAYNAEMLAPPGTFVHMTRARISDHAVARNGLADGFLGDWLVMLDTDHVPEPDIVARLVGAANRYGIDVLSGVYRMKGHPHHPVLYEWIPNPDDEDGPEVLRQVVGWTIDAGFLEIGSAGGGCLFVRRSVFDRIRDELHELPFEHIPPYSEDHSFFYRCRRLGITPFAALHIKSHHLRVAAVTDADAFMPGKAGMELEVAGIGRG